jgi:hypothetical protein
MGNMQEGKVEMVVTKMISIKYRHDILAIDITLVI